MKVAQSDVVLVGDCEWLGEPSQRNDVKWCCGSGPVLLNLWEFIHVTVIFDTLAVLPFFSSRKQQLFDGNYSFKTRNYISYLLLFVKVKLGLNKC